MKIISFVILTWNSEKYIIQCLDSIKESVANWNVVVYIIDNGSQDKTTNKIELWKNNNSDITVDLVKLKANKGTTVSRNIGLKKAARRGGYICVLDSDTQINAASMLHMATALETHLDFGIVGPRLIGHNGELQNSGRNVPTLTMKLMKVLPFAHFTKKGEAMEVIEKKDTFTSVGYLMSACWMMRSDLIDKIGLLDENIFYAPEDAEYCMRSWKYGYKVIYDKDVWITHAWQRLSRKKLFSKHNYEHIKGLIYLFIKYKYCFKLNVLKLH